MTTLHQPFTAPQLTVLKALANAAFQAHTAPDQVKQIIDALPADAPQWQRERALAFAQSSFTDLEGSLDLLGHQFVCSLSQTNVDALSLTLNLLSSRPGTLLLTGHLRSFVNLTLAEREKVLQSWSASPLLLLRKAYRGFVALTLFVAYNSIPEVVLATGYPAGGDPLLETQQARIKPSYPFKFENISSDYQIIDTDVLVIGSGAGGGVVSSELARKGWKVTVVEKGIYVPNEKMTSTPAHGLKTLFQSEGIMVNEDGSMNILAGSNFGGGTSVNWSASLRPQHYVREAWAKQFGLPHFLSQEFTDSLDFVCARMGVSEKHLVHSKGNDKLVIGSKALGYHIDDIPQNTGGNTHSCGFCSFGCPYGEKQGGTATWLTDAAEHGTTFYQSIEVTRLLFASSTSKVQPTPTTLHNFTPSAGRRKCIGALLIDHKTGLKSLVRAKEAVVVSGGSINSPAILLRSGLKGSKIGKNLHLHPVSYVTGYFEEAINPWEGSIMTAVSNVRENVDGTHHGVKIEVVFSFPGGTASGFQPWTSSLEHKKAMMNYNHSFTLIALTRDRDSGRVIIDAKGQPRVEYTLSSYDGQSLLAGVIAGAEIMLAAQALKIVTTQVGVPDYVPAPGHAGLNDPAWKTWIALVQKAGVRPSWSAIGSAHQMGSNSMGTKPTNSAVDPRGRLWGTESLYVADASVFPTASGVNPMITTMATAHSIAQFIDQDLRAKNVDGFVQPRL